MRVCGVCGRRGEGLWRRWGDPGSGTEPSDHVGNCAREGRSLPDAAVERVDACTKWGVCVDFDVREGFGYPLSVATRWETDNVKREELEFSGDTIKVFFFVFVYLSKEWKVRSVTDCTLKGKEVIEGKFSTGAAFSIGSNHVIKDIGGFDGGSKACIDNGV